MTKINPEMPETLAKLIAADPAVKLYVETVSYRDGLTGMWNRRFFQTELERRFEEARRDGQDISLIIGDIDRFKQLNDTYGHRLGDSVLRYIGQTLTASPARPADSYCRMGGEEFGIILPETGLEGASHIAEFHRNRIEKTDFAGYLEAGRDKARRAGGPTDAYESDLLVMKAAGRPDLTMSFGVAAYPGASVVNMVGLYECADKALYLAKDSGRNAVRTMDQLNL